MNPGLSSHVVCGDTGLHIMHLYRLQSLNIFKTRRGFETSSGIPNNTFYYDLLISSTDNTCGSLLVQTT